MDLTCADRNKFCNCDKDGAVNLVDEGLLTDKDSLPVTQLRFGDRADSSSSSSYELGKLRCRGNGKVLVGVKWDKFLLFKTVVWFLGQVVKNKTVYDACNLIGIQQAPIRCSFPIYFGRRMAQKSETWKQKFMRWKRLQLWIHFPPEVKRSEKQTASPIKEKSFLKFFDTVKD